MTPELLYPKIDPECYLGLAKELSLRKDSISKRTAADRAFYGAYLTVRDILQSKGYADFSGSVEDYKYVDRVLKSPAVLGSSGSQMLRLRLARIRATYNTRDLYLGNPQDCRRLDWIFDTAIKLIEKVKTLSENK